MLDTIEQERDNGVAHVRRLLETMQNYFQVMYW